MRIVVTGGAGFIGSNLVDRLLARKHSVTVIDNLSGGERSFLAHHRSNARFELIKLDLRKTKQLTAALPAKLDLVYHLAANSDISRGVEDPTLDFHNGVEATFSLLQAMRARGANKLLYTSGSGIYGDRGHHYCSEQQGGLEPVSMYGAAKLGCEGLVSAFAHLFDLQAWIFRPANIIGPRATHGVVYDFVQRLRRDPTALRILGDGRQSKSYLHVDDVLDAFEMALAKARSKINVFNLSSPTFITVNKIADEVIRGLGIDARSVQRTHTGGKVGWKGDVSVVRLSCSPIRKLGWRPRYTSAAAVRATVAALAADARLAARETARPRARSHKT